jgi:choline dehydrogenase-like flavoprotein
MIIDFRKTATPTEYDTDLCIIGSGAAGLTLADQASATLRVLVVEAGGRKVPKGRDEWLIGEAADFAFTGFEDGRACAYGGATRKWFGQLLRFDPIDFEKRDWVPHSGWPLTAADLAPYYDRAEPYLGVGHPDYDARIWPRFGMRDPGFDHREVTPRFTAYMPQPDFTKGFGKKLESNLALDILLNAAGVHLDLDPAGQRITGLQLRGDGGRVGLVRARAYVICGGGIENPRLLLASNAVMANGIGNANDLVGRYFQDHPSGTTGTLTTTQPRVVQAQFRKLRRAGVTYWPKLALTAAAQREGRYLNANSLMLYDYADNSALSRAKGAVEAAQARNPAAMVRDGLRLLPHLPELAGRLGHTVITGKAPMFVPSKLMLKSHVEQVPDPGNRVTLSAERDRFGMPRPRLAWRVHPDELRTMRGMTEAVGRAFKRLGWGDMAVSPWVDGTPDAARPELEDTFHHAGATRMGSTPAEGVVDPDCRVFGTDNLYIAGGSVFPTSSYVNPTLTIVALALRLSDTLQTRLGAA